MDRDDAMLHLPQVPEVVARAVISPGAWLLIPRCLHTEAKGALVSDGLEQRAACLTQGRPLPRGRRQNVVARLRLVAPDGARWRARLF